MQKILRIKHSLEFEKQLKLLQDSKFHRTLLKAIEREKNCLLQNSHKGDHIEKIKIPKEYIQKYNVKNLWKINLPNYWRMLYTIVGNELEIISILLEFMDHKKYNKLFKYKKK